MELDELRSIIKRELDSALGVEGGRLSANRREALEYYEGEPFGDEQEGRSSVIMRTVLETVEWVLPALLRIFCASDKIAEFEPTQATDEDAAKQTTDYVSYIFYRDNPGFVNLHNWFKDALIQKVGWLKVYWNTERKVETNTFSGLTEAEYQAMVSGDDVTVIEEKKYPAPAAGGFYGDAPMPGQAVLYDCTLRTVRSQGRVKIEPVPPEEVLTSRRAKTATDLPFVCHRRQRTVSDLLQAGYQREQVMRLQGYDEQEYNTERVVRYSREDDFPFMTDRIDPAMRIVWVEESYIRVDWDGDGIAELRKITSAGNAREILIREDGELDNEEVDETPLIAICPILMPHKLIGMSLADLVMDLQLIKSVLVRQMLDNLYLTNAPRHAIEEGAAGANTYDDLLTVRPGGLVRLQRVSGLMPLPVPFVAGAAFPMLEYLDQTIETRTGVARHNQGLNPDDLNKTATGVNLIQQAAAQRVELIARIFAETGIKELSTRILGLVTKYQQAERIIRLTGKWVPMDPRQWRNEMQVNVSVGLGTGNRDQILQHLMQLLQVQQGIVMMQKGVEGPLVTAQNVYDVLSKLTENAGFKEEFFTDPSAPPQQGAGMPTGAGPQPPMDPEAMKAMGQLQIKQQESHAEIQEQQARMAADMQLERLKAQFQMQLAQDKAAHDMQLEQQKAAHAMELERTREAARQEQALREIELRGRLGAYTTGGPTNGSGGASA